MTIRAGTGLVLGVAGALAAGAASERFTRADRNGDGRLSREELPPAVQEAFDRIDGDRDGAITEAEFDAFLRSRPFAGGQGAGAAGLSGVRRVANLNYAGTTNTRQSLDLLLPEKPATTGALPLVVFIHGGGWQNGSKDTGVRHLARMVEGGEYAGAAINYRLTDQATWPAQIHDCKAAVRWLRAHAKEYGWDPDRIGVWGSSAGGHLTAMVALSGGVRDLEGALGAHTGVDSRVQCAVDYFGPADFTDMAARTKAASDPEGPVAKLLGGAVTDRVEAAKSASPVTYATRDDPPLLIVHGTRDSTVPFSQSERLQEALRKAAVAKAPILIPVNGAGHGFRNPEVGARVKQFFDHHLRGQGTPPEAKAIEEAGRSR